MPFVSLVVKLCYALAGSPVCVEEIIADSDTVPALTEFTCSAPTIQQELAQWKMADPVYSSDRYWIGKYQCVKGHPGLRGKA